MNERAQGNVLVACVGDRSYGDDGFGVAVAYELDSLDLPDQVVVVDYGLRGLDLACALLEPWSAAVMVGAVARGGAPGDLYLLEVEQGAEDETVTDPQFMNPYRVLALARSMGEITAPVYLVGCEPDDLGEEFEGRIGLSNPVAAAVPEATRMVEWLIRQRLPVEALAGER